MLCGFGDRPDDLEVSAASDAHGIQTLYYFAVTVLLTPQVEQTYQYVCRRIEALDDHDHRSHGLVDQIMLFNMYQFV